jgi:glutamate racemase
MIPRILFVFTLALAARAASIVEHVQSHPDGKAPWTIDFSKLDGDRSQLPIGVFDSGIGGLTVLEAILQLDTFNNDTLKPGADGKPDFAGEKFIYFGDQANMPYGNYPSKGQTEFLRELAIKDAIFLLGTRWRGGATGEVHFGKPPVKAIVIACNTATAYALDDIRTALRTWKLDIPVIGVVEAGARDVASILPDDGKAHGVAVLATVGTCDSKAYPRAIAQATGRAGKSAPSVVQQGSIGLAGAIEGNQAFVTPSKSRPFNYQGPAPDAKLWNAYQFAPEGLLGQEINSVANYVRYDVTTLLETRCREQGPAIDTVVLGCTHFPLVKNEMTEAFRRAREFTSADGSHPYAAVVAEHVSFIDPAEATARELFVELARARLRNKTSAQNPSSEFFFSVPNPSAPTVKLAADGSLDGDYKTSRLTGRFEVEDTVVVPLTLETLPASSAKLVRALPAVSRALEAKQPR